MSELSIDDALLYMDQVKVEFGDRPQIYKEFLDIMRTFKKGKIDTLRVMQRVSTLFHCHRRLLLDFNMFLPQGYKIELPLIDGDDGPPAVAVVRAPGSNVAHSILHSTGPLVSSSSLNPTTVVAPCSSSTGQPPAVAPTALLTANTWWNVVAGRKEGITPLLERCKRHLAWDDAYTKLVGMAYRDFLECKVFVHDWGDNDDDATTTTTTSTKLSPSIPVDKMWHEHILDSKRYTKDCNLLFGRIIHHDPDGDVIDAQARRVRIENTRALIATRNGPEILNSRAWDFGVVVAAAPSEGANIVSPGDAGADPADPVGAGAGAAVVGVPSLRHRRIAPSPLPRDTKRNVRARKEEKPVPIIIITIIDFPTGEEIRFRMKMTTKLEKIFNVFAQRKGVQVSSLRFLLNGDRLDPNETPLSLELDESERIHAHAESFGC